VAEREKRESEKKKEGCSFCNGEVPTLAANRCRRPSHTPVDDEQQVLSLILRGTCYLNPSIGNKRDPQP